MNNILTITPDHDGQRLDRWMKKVFPQIPYGQSQKLIRTGQIRIDGKRAKADTVLLEGQAVRLPPQLLHMDRPEKKDTISKADQSFIRNLVLYEDDQLIVINKPHGLAVQGGSKTHRHVDGLLDGLRRSTQDPRPKLLHRIDKETSGILLCGKTNNYTKFIMQKFKQKGIDKTYLAICSPAPKIKAGTISAPVKKARIGGMERMIIDEDDGQKAITHFEIIDSIGKDAALVKFSPVTGRTHQIRIHSEYAGFPIIGDPKYNRASNIDQNMSEEEFLDQRKSIEDLCRYKGLHLHAYRVTLPSQHNKNHPLTLTAPLSEDMSKSLNSLGLTLDEEL